MRERSVGHKVDSAGSGSPIGERARDAEKVQPEGGKESETAVCSGSTPQRILRESGRVHFIMISFECTASYYYFFSFCSEIAQGLDVKIKNGGWLCRNSTCFL